MALELPDDGFTGHITWQSRGYSPIEFDELEARGLTPISAPGALDGVRYSAVFRRLWEGEWAVRGVAAGTGWAQVVRHAVRSFGIPSNEFRTMFSSYREHIWFLDGGLDFYAADYGFSGPPWMHVRGTQALRLICHRLGIVQPRQLYDEDEVPSLAAIEGRLRAEVMLKALTKRGGGRIR